MQTLYEGKGNYAKLYELDNEFHRLLFDGGPKARAWKLLQQMNTHFDRLSMLRLASASKLGHHHVTTKRLFFSGRNAEASSKRMFKRSHLDLFKDGQGRVDSR